jgi:hypothetical protein
MPQQQQQQQQQQQKDKEPQIQGPSLNRFLLKVKYSFYSTLVFFIFANPETFRIIHGLIGHFLPIIKGTGVPTPAGFFLSAFLFFATMLGLMMLPAE